MNRIRFYHVMLESGKDIYINPTHIVYAEFRNDPAECQMKMVNGDIFNFYLKDILDNMSLSKEIKTRYSI